MNVENQRLKKLIPLPQEWQEWQYRHIERLGHLCANNNPSLPQIELARREADAWLEQQPLQSCLDAFERSDLEPVLIFARDLTMEGMKGSNGNQ